MDRLVTQDLAIGYDDRLIVEGLNLSIPTGKITALVGSNGSGKSTILKTMARIMKPQRGCVLLDGKAIHAQSTREVAKQLAILPQNPVAPEGLTVRELVGYGRYPHQRGFGTMSREDREIVEWAIEMTGLSAFADRAVDQLSGGQRQRAWIAMALAQDPDVLLLDEPTTFLDLTHQLEVLDLLQHLNRTRGTTVVMVLHDLNLAARYADHLVVMADGRVLAEGAPAEVVTPDVLRAAFRLDALVVPDPVTGAPMVVPRRATPPEDVTANDVHTADAALPGGVSQ